MSDRIVSVLVELFHAPDDRRKGRAIGVVARPSVVHFGGFELNQTQTIVVRLINASREAIRMHILPPTTPDFTIRCVKKVCLHVPSRQICRVCSADSGLNVLL